MDEVHSGATQRVNNHSFNCNFSPFYCFSERERPSFSSSQQLLARWSGLNNRKELGSLLTAEDSIKRQCTELNVHTHRHIHSHPEVQTEHSKVHVHRSNVWPSVCELYLTAGIFWSCEKTHRHTSLCTLRNLTPLLGASRTLEDENDGGQEETELLKG